MDHPSLKSVLLAAACSLALASAQAANVSASVDELTFTLVDLDPHDGIEPSITWTALSGDVFTSASSGMQVMWVDAAQGIWTPQHATVHPDVALNDSITPFPVLAGASASAQAGLSASSVSASYSAPHDGGQGAATASLMVGFELSPMTQLVLSGRLAWALQAPGGEQAALPAGASTSSYLPFATMSVYADVALDVTSGSAPGAASWSDFEVQNVANHTVGTDPGGDTAALQQAFSRTFAYTLSNDGVGALGGAFRSLVTVSGSQLAQQATVVPEPAGAGLAAAGALIGLVGVGARRRRSLRQA
ncbi:MAG: hypothetical protein IIA02_06900 [Proteobacteria bacterium]|uniref:hypothetical protein n=1 Tax=Aquabacterium sp. TaxID=1872578 RepID=UPI0035C6BDD4|nr:hypothetical protein [Pseudomonadota bacterium]